MPVGLQIKRQTSGLSARCDHTSLSQVAQHGCLLSRHCLSPIPLKRRECPQDYMVERPAQPGGPGFVSRFRANGIAQKNCLAPRLSRCFLKFNDECRWEYIGNQRVQTPPARSRDRMRILINSCRHFADFVTNADGTTSLKRTRFRVRIPVAPADGAIAQRWSALNTFHQFCRHSPFRDECRSNYM